MAKAIIASRMIAIGSLVGYAAGTIDLVKIFGPTLGDSQFKQLALIAAVFFNVAVGLTAWAVQERVLISAKYDDCSTPYVDKTDQAKETLMLSLTSSKCLIKS